MAVSCGAHLRGGGIHPPLLLPRWHAWCVPIHVPSHGADDSSPSWRSHECPVFIRLFKTLTFSKGKKKPKTGLSLRQLVIGSANGLPPCCVLAPCRSREPSTCPPQSHSPVPSHFSNSVKGICFPCVFPTG